MRRRIVTNVAVQSVPSWAACHRYSPTKRGEGRRTGEYQPVRESASQTRMSRAKKMAEVARRFTRRPPLRGEALESGGDFAGVLGEPYAVDIAWALKGNLELAADAPGIWREEHYAISQAGSFTHIVGDEDDRLAAGFPDALNISVELFAVSASSAPKGSSMSRTRGIRRQGPREGNTLFHAAGKLMNIRMGEALKANELEIVAGDLKPFPGIQSRLKI